MYPGDCVTIALHNAPADLLRVIVVTGEKVCLLGYAMQFAILVFSTVCNHEENQNRVQKQNLCVIGWGL